MLRSSSLRSFFFLFFAPHCLFVNLLRATRRFVSQGCPFNSNNVLSFYSLLSLSIERGWWRDSAYPGSSLCHNSNYIQEKTGRYPTGSKQQPIRNEFTGESLIRRVHPTNGVASKEIDLDANWISSSLEHCSLLLRTTRS